MTGLEYEWLLFAAVVLVVALYRWLKGRKGE